jgi:phospholipase D1/2
MANASRVAVIVDAETYFRTVKEAMLAAQHSIYMLGWDFDARTGFEQEPPTLEGPNTLGAFLRWIGKSRPQVDVHILKWDLGLLLELGRGTTPLVIVGWMASKRIHFKLDTAHPKGAAQHQKVVVIDDALAFCGGIDLTVDRWDTRQHLDDDERRIRPSGKPYGPWHDATTMVDGAAGRALGDLARQRWQAVTGETLDPPPAVDSIWPKGINPDFTDIDIAIARTVPEYGEIQEVREIEALYLDAIAAAERTIYCESQYFASRRIAEAVAERLDQPDGPEIVVVNPESPDGYLEAAVMDSARARLLEMVSRRRHASQRFRIYTPVTLGGMPIYVHAKLLIIDERLLRVGSSNCNNRSMGFDVECDLAVEAVAGTPNAATISARIAAIRNDLLAEHLGTTAEKVETAMRANGGSLIAAIESLMGDRRSLVPYRPKEPGVLEVALADSDLLDPEGPPGFRHRTRSFLTWSARPLR